MTSTSGARALDAPPAPVPATGRVQLALTVDDLDEAVAFYTSLLGAPPAKRRPGYANFAVARPPLKLVLLEDPGEGGRLDHLGIEVPGPEDVSREILRLTDEGVLTTEQRSTTCCFATQDKVWVTAPDGERWEVYTVLADSTTFGAAPAAAAATGRAPSAAAADSTSPMPGPAAPCC